MLLLFFGLGLGLGGAWGYAEDAAIPGVFRLGRRRDGPVAEPVKAEGGELILREGTENCGVNHEGERRGGGGRGGRLGLDQGVGLELVRDRGGGLLYRDYP